MAILEKFYHWHRSVGIWIEERAFGTSFLECYFLDAFLKIKNKNNMRIWGSGVSWIFLHSSITLEQFEKLHWNTLDASGLFSDGSILWKPCQSDVFSRQVVVLFIYRHMVQINREDILNAKSGSWTEHRNVRQLCICCNAAFLPNLGCCLRVHRTVCEYL